MKLSVDFAFAGIEIIRKNPMAVLAWSLVSFLFSLASYALTVTLAGPAMTAIMGYEQSPPEDPMMVWSQLGALAPVWLIGVVASLLIGAVVQCAVYRSQLQPQAKGFGFMQLGGAELRQALVLVLWVLAFVFFYILFVLAVALLGAIGGMVSQSSAIVGGLLIFFCVGASLVAFVYIVARWSLAGVQSYAEEKIDIFGSFKLTKGNGWILLGGYALLVIVIIIVAIVVYTVLAAVTFGAGGNIVETFRQMSRPDLTSFAALMTPAMIVRMVVSALMSGVFTALFYGATVAAYQTLSAKKLDVPGIF